MATLTIRNLDDNLKAKLRVEAAKHGRSMEEHARIILRQALEKPQRGLGSRIHSRVAVIGGAEIDIPSRQELPRAADLPE